MGSASLLSDKGFWKANLSVIHKVCFLNGLLYYIATAMVREELVSKILRYFWLVPDSVKSKKYVQKI